jgi:hypothetical protein
MIKTFEDHTFELTSEERFVVQTIIKRFEFKKGKEFIVTGDQIKEGINKHLNLEYDTVRIRKMIQYIRTNDLISGLIATSKGYYVAKTAEEIELWIESLKSRENAIRTIREVAEDTVRKMKSNLIQTTLFN